MLNFVMKLVKKLNEMISIFVKIFVAVVVIASLFYIFLLPSKASAAYGLSTTIKQVKTADSPTVYYLDHNRGLKKAYVNAASYLAYGNKWSDIKIISQEQLDKWPELHIVKAAGQIAVYYIANAKKAYIESANQLFSLGYAWKDLITIAKADLDNYQTATLTDIKNSAAITMNNDNDNGEPRLEVKLDSDSPSAGYLPLNTSKNLVAIFDFKAYGQPAQIKSLTFNLNGVYQVEAINRIYLANQGDYIYDIPASVNDRQAMFNFGNETLTVSPGQEVKLKVYLDLVGTQNPVAYTISASLNQASSISDNLTIIGNFPVSSNTFKFAPGSDIGQARIDEQSIGSGFGAVIGTTNKIIAKFKIAEISGKEDIIIKQLKLNDNGTAADSDLKNLKLVDSNNVTVAQVLAAGQNTVTFNLNDYKIKKNSDQTFLVLADIAGGENRNINLNLSDTWIVGADYGFALSINFSNLNEQINLIRQPLSVIANDLKANDKVFAQQSGVIIGNFQIRNNDQTINLKNININLVKNGGAPDLTGSISLVDYSSGQVYDAGSAAKLAERSLDLSFNNLLLSPKQELTFSLITDIPAIVRDGDNYKIVVNRITYQDVNHLTYQDNLVVGGVTLVVSKSSLYIYPNNTEQSQTFTKGQKNIKIASFILEVSAGDNIVISNLTLAKSDQTSGGLLYENGFNNVRAYIGFSPAKTNLDQPFGTTYFFDGFNFTLTAGSRAEVKIYADTVKDLKVSSIQLAVANITARSSKSGLMTVISGLNTDSYETYFVNASTELHELNGGTVTSGTKSNNVAGFSVTNTGGEEIRLSKINIITSTEGFSNSLGYSNLTITDKTKNINIGTVYQPVAGANSVNLWTYYTIKPNETINFTVTVDANDSVPSGSFNIYFSGLEAFGKTSNIAADVSGSPTDSVQVVVSGTGNSN